MLTLVCISPYASSFHMLPNKLEQHTENVKLHPFVRYQITPKTTTVDSMIFEPELHHGWLQSDQEVPVFIKPHHAVWLVSALEYQGKTPYHGVLEFSFPLADEVDFYLFDRESSQITPLLKSGNQFVFSERPIASRTYTVHVEILPGQEFELYTRIVDDGINTFHWELFNEKVYFDQKFFKLILIGIVIGILLLIAARQATLLYLYRNAKSTYILLTSISFLMFYLTYTGLGFQYLWPNEPEINQSVLYISGGLLIASIVKFADQVLLEDSTRNEQLFMSTLLFSGFIVLFSPLFFPSHWRPMIFLIIVFITCVGLFFSCVNRVLKDRKHLDLAICYFMILMSAFMLAASHLGFFSNMRIPEYVAITLALSVLMYFSFAYHPAGKLVKGENHPTEVDILDMPLASFRDIYQHSLVGLFTASMDGRLLSANQAFIEMLGFQSFEELKAFVSRHGPARFIAEKAQIHLIKEKLTQRQVIQNEEIRLLRRSSHSFWAQISLQMVHSETDRQYIIYGTMTDISEQHQTNQQLQYLASHDSLTGTLSRTEFEKRLHKTHIAIQSGQSAATLLMVDIHKFKEIHEACGHAAGDSLLRQLSDILKTSIGQRGNIARHDGSEFLVLLPEASGNQAFVTAYRLQEAIKEVRFTWEASAFSVESSIGMVEIGQERHSLEELMEEAEIACQSAKSKGVNRIHIFTEEDRTEHRQANQQGRSNKLESAIEACQFQLYFQNIRSLHQTTIHPKYEIILRLEMDDQLILPDTILPIAERLHIMPTVDRWVISTYFQWLSTQTAHMEKLGMACINLSGSSLADVSFKDFVVEAFRKYQIPHHLICFEIKETVAIVNAQASLDFIQTLRPLGCQFALDDFGSGFSSYTYIKHLPVDYIKVDGGFVKDILIDPIDKAMVSAIQEVAKAMNIKTIAESVESDDVMIDLREMGIDYVQGYALHQPTTLDELAMPHVSRSSVN